MKQERPKVEVATGPPGICPDCLRRNTVGNERVIAIHCAHSSGGVGAVMVLVKGEPSGLWQTYSPITAERWADALISGHEIVAAILAQKVAAAGGEDPPDSHKTSH